MAIKTISKIILTVVAALTLTVATSFAASQFEGTWNVKDTAGAPFQITLSSDGSAKANREGEGMSGTWKEEGSAAIITWNTGWTTKISKSDGSFTKAAYKKGASLAGKPTNSSAAEKAE